ncbi:MAG: hemolysin D, partial [Thermoguttaceae bacterium]|nr:hemolysin D [Thermoguttaceae bacterium]
MSSEQRYEPSLLEQTKQQIRVLVNEIAQISRSEVSPEEFHAEFLQRVVSALGAIGGAIWTSDNGRLSLGYQINLQETHLHEDEEANKTHSALLYRTLRGEEADALVPAHSGGESANEGGNPTGFLVILSVMQTELEKVGIIEIFQRPEANAVTQKGYLQFVRQVTRYAADFYKNRQLKNFSDRQSLWTQLEDFTRNIHKTLELRETVYTVANESRRLIECDRVSIAICRGRRARIEAVSGQDMVDKRSETVKLLGDLATAVVAANEPIVYTGDSSNLAPQVERALEEYVDASHTKTIAVYPLTARTIDENDHDETERDKVVVPPPFGAIIVELIEDARVSEHMMKRVEIVVEHARVAIGNAIDHN